MIQPDSPFLSISFNVAKGEEAPEMGDVPPVSGVAHRHCNWDVPYKVGGSMTDRREPGLQIWDSESPESFLKIFIHYSHRHHALR